MRQMLHIFYFAVFMFLHKGYKPIDLETIERKDFIKFHDGVWNGDISLADSNMKLEYALVHMEQIRHNMQMKRLDESLRIISK